MGMRRRGEGETAPSVSILPPVDILFVGVWCHVSSSLLISNRPGIEASCILKHFPPPSMCESNRGNVNENNQNPLIFETVSYHHYPWMCGWLREFYNCQSWSSWISWRFVYLQQQQDVDDLGKWLPARESTVISGWSIRPYLVANAVFNLSPTVLECYEAELPCSPSTTYILLCCD